MKSIPLHNPGCNNPDKICSPHPTGISDIIYAINHPVKIAVPLVFIAVVVLSIGLYRRWQNTAGGFWDLPLHQQALAIVMAVPCSLLMKALVENLTQDDEQ